MKKKIYSNRPQTINAIIRGMTSFRLLATQVSTVSLQES